MPTNYKIEIIFPQDMSEFFWCIIKIDTTNSYNIGCGLATSYYEAAQNAYNYLTQHIIPSHN